MILHKIYSGLGVSYGFGIAEIHQVQRVQKPRRHLPQCIMDEKATESRYSYRSITCVGSDL